MESEKKNDLEKKAEPAIKKAEPKKYLVIKNFTADKQYYIGNVFVTDSKTLANTLLNSKLIK